jgi:hypothetical protein
MNEAVPAFTRHLRASEGYIELGMHLDADEELERIEPEHRDATAVLELRVRIYRKLEKWELMQAMAKRVSKN